MSYLVLARKYRPQSFEAVVRQEHVTQTLTNAIGAGRVAHAILFSGPRGTGKTTIARILAKAMNCINGPTPTPCNSCQSCEEITAGSAADVFEIDGASNNSVDQIRDLRENIRYMPSHSRYKIYIIDEVHMLSIAAFNALLKTLEEPPEHVLFFFATTEPNKIPITILSRCQRYDLKRIDSEALIAHMKMLCHEEGREMPVQSLAQIAKEADGSMRDALSLLDQILASTSEAVPPEQVLAMIGGAERELLHRMAEGVLQRDVDVLLSSLDEAYQKGTDLKKLYQDLVGHFRDLMVVAIDTRGNAAADVSEDTDLLKRQLEMVSMPTLNQMFRLLYNESRTVQYAPDVKMAFEMVIFQLHQIVPTLSVDTLIEKLDGLRNTLQHGIAVPAAEAAPAPDCGVSREDEDNPTPAPIAPSGAEPEPAPVTEGTPAEIWDGFRDALSRKHPSLAAHLANSHIKHLDDQRLVIVLTGNGFNANMIKRPKPLEQLRTFCREYFGRPLDVDVVASQGSVHRQENEKKKKERVTREVLQHPIVEDAMTIFKGELVEIKPIQEEKP